MQLLLDHPLWVVLILLTVLIHVAFFFGIRHVMRKAQENAPTATHDSDAPSA